MLRQAYATTVANENPTAADLATAVDADEPDSVQFDEVKIEAGGNVAKKEDDDLFFPDEVEEDDEDDLDLPYASSLYLCCVASPHPDAPALQHDLADRDGCGGDAARSLPRNLHAGDRRRHARRKGRHQARGKGSDELQAQGTRLTRLF